MQSKCLKRALIAAAAAGNFFAAAVQAGVVGQGTWETTLQPRDVDGDGYTDAFYDTTLDITWLRYADSDTLLTWTAANTWANNLVLGGYGGWRLPTIVDTGSPGCTQSYAGDTECGFNVLTKSGDPGEYEIGQTVYSEVAHLWYVTLGNKALCDPATSTDSVCVVQPDWGLTNTGPLLNIHPYFHWLRESYAGNSGDAWLFQPFTGFQGYSYQFQELYAMRVHDGDIGSPVPESETFALMLVGLCVLGMLVNKRK